MGAGGGDRLELYITRISPVFSKTADGKAPAELNF
jgi:hypothetical protein